MIFLNNKKKTLNIVKIAMNFVVVSITRANII